MLYFTKHPPCADVALLLPTVLRCWSSVQLTLMGSFVPRCPLPHAGVANLCCAVIDPPSSDIDAPTRKDSFMPRHLWISALSGIFLTGFWVILSVVTAAAQSSSPTTTFTTPTADHPYIGKQLLTLPAPPTGDQQPEPSSIAPAQASQPQTPLGPWHRFRAN